MWIVYILLLVLCSTGQLVTGSRAHNKTHYNASITNFTLHSSNYIPTIPLSETAYVGIHYEQNNYYDHIMLTGLRTMMKTIEQTQTQRDRIVLILPHTKQATRDLLTSDGLKLIEASPKLYNNAQNKCWYEFRVIDLFQLIQYKRLIYLDSDHLVVNNMDELFFCGEFCMQYSSLIHFTDTVFVVKPTISKYNMLMDRFHALNYNDEPPKFCIDDAAAFWIHAFGNIEAAPLFPITPTHQYTEQSMRLAASTSLNAMLWYEKFSWSLMKHDKYMNITDPNTPPGLAIGFHSLKPFFWPAGIFFNLNWLWTQRRTELLHESYIKYIVTTALLLSLFYITATKLVRAAFYVYYTKWRRSSINTILNTIIRNMIHPVAYYRSVTPRSKQSNAVDREQLIDNEESNRNALTKLGSILYKIISLIGLWCPLVLSAYLCSQGMRDRNHAFVLVSTTVATVFGMISIEGNWLYVLGSDICGWVFGLPMDVCLGYIVYEFIPSLTPPHYAWPTFILAQCIAKYTCQHIIVLSYSYQSNNSTVAPYAYSPVRRRSLNENGNHISDAKPDTSTNTTVLQLPFSSLHWHIFWSFVAWSLCRLTFFPEFAVKMAILFPVLIVAFWTSINSYRNALRLIEQDYNNKKHLPN